MPNFTPLVDIVLDRKIITHQKDDGYMTSVYELNQDGSMGFPLWDFPAETPNRAKVIHHREIIKAKKPSDTVHNGICASCGKEKLLVFKKRDGDWYCSQCRDLFVEGCE